MHESAVPGVVKIHDDGMISLELNSFLSSRRPFGSFSRKSSGDEDLVIQGLLKGNAGYVLIFAPYESGFSHSFRGLSHQSFQADACLRGRKIFPDSSKKLGFHGFEVDLSGVGQWASQDSIKLTEKRGSRLSIDWKPPKDARYKISVGEVVVKYRANHSSNEGVRTTSFELQESPYIDLRVRKGVEIERLRGFFLRLEELLVILCDCRVSLDWPVVKVGSKRDRCTYYFRRPFLSSETPEYHKICISYSSLLDDFGKVFDGWMSGYEEFGAGFYLYIGTFRAVGAYAENKYVNLIWGLESLHRRTFPEANNNPEIVAKVDRILEKHSGKDRKWLKGKLKRSAEPALQDRLLELFSILPIKFDAGSMREFCRECADRRNDISHFGGDRGDGGRLDFLQEIFMKSMAISKLYHAIILKKIGISDDHIKWWLLDGYSSFQTKSIFSDVGLVLVE